MGLLRFKYTFTFIVSILTAGGFAHAGEFDAELDWSDFYIAAFPMDGGVSDVHVRPGDRVDRGQKLIELDREPVAIRVNRYVAELAAREPVLADAKREYEQAESLYEQTVLSEVERQRAQHAFEKARAEVTAARARLDFARWQLKKTAVHAPFDAWVVERDVEPGQMLVDERRSGRLIVLANRGVMRASALLPLPQVKRVQTGLEATVAVDGARYPARVISMTLQPASGHDASHYRITAEFSVNPEDRLRAGQSAKIILP